MTFDLCVRAAVVTPPSGARYQPQLIDRRDGFVVARCVPTEPGLHHLSVSYDDVPVDGSPWQFTAEPVSLAQWRAYGAGLSHGVATAPCTFTVRSPHDKMPGQLHTGRSDVAVTCRHNTISMLWGNATYCVNHTVRRVAPQHRDRIV